MNEPIESIKDKLIVMGDQPVLLDRDVAALYGVETKRINEAVRRNIEKFPSSYRFPLQAADIQRLVANCDRFKTLKHSPSTTYAFTEKGLYMLATILKSPIAVEATFEIIETFATVKDLQRSLLALHREADPGKKQKLMSRFSELISDIVLPELRPEETETTLELNFFIGKLKHTVKRKRRDNGPDIVEEPEILYGKEDED